MYDWEDTDEILKFDVNKARELVDKKNKDELKRTLTLIKDQAEQGKYELYVFTPLKTSTKKDLITKGFTVSDSNGISVQKDGVYHIIRW